MENPYLPKEYKERLKALYPSKRKLRSVHINFTKAFYKKFDVYHYRGTYFRELTFTLYFIEINFNIIYEPIYKPDLLWSEEEIKILKKQGKPPLKINKIPPISRITPPRTT